MIDIKENPRLNRLNHSCAHVLAQAVKRIYPQAKFWVGPVISEGFYYDIDLGDITLKEEDLPAIEKEMKKIIKDGKRIFREEISKAEALELFKDDEYKLDLINNMNPDSTVISIYKQAEFADLCRGPHEDNVKACRYFKLLKVSGAYWKNDANNKMLQRVYGVCLSSKEELEEHLNLLEEAKKSDHKKLGKELELFMNSEFGPGFPFFLPKGMTVLKLLKDYWYEVHQQDYHFIQTPIMLSKELWETSGHWANYRDNMYTSSIDEREFAIKPMNCPGGMLVYKNGLHSYKDLPLRIGELGLVHRHEASGALNGLFRVRSFTQDDAHIFMTPDQIESEVVKLIGLIDKIYSQFDLTYTIELSTRPTDKFIGDIATWDYSEKALQNACQAAGKDFVINPGDGAFYGPKLDFKIKDSLGRIWQCATIQLDANLPERFDLTYIDSNGIRQRPVMLHRAIFGSIERFLGILIEHYGGAFPLWLAPTQVVITPVHPEEHFEYSQKLQQALEKEGIRVELDNRNEKLGYRLREAQMKKVPYQLVIGDEEVANESVNIRLYGTKATVVKPMSEFVELISADNKNRIA
ncbi:MAG: threonine--tRNA ligase [Erysipelotrichaceae bacterium]